MKRTKILSTGRYSPKKVLTNIDLEKIVETNDEWVFERTGIKERRISNPDGGEYPSDMAVFAAQKAFKKIDFNPKNLDMILLSTMTPDYKLPNTASVVQTKLGMQGKCACLDIAAACSGFVYAINMADGLIKSSLMKNILVIGTEMMSREVNWKDRNTCILFGDGCGVALVGSGEDDESEILASTLGADGNGRKFFDQPIGGAVEPLNETHLKKENYFMQMQGREMFKVASRTLAESGEAVLKKANLQVSDVDWLIPHQANKRIIEATAKMLALPMDKVIVNIEKYGNTSAATIPLAFDEAIEAGKIKRGDIVLFDAFGAGLTSGATLLKF